MHQCTAHKACLHPTNILANTHLTHLHNAYYTQLSLCLPVHLTHFVRDNVSLLTDGGKELAKEKYEFVADVQAREKEIEAAFVTLKGLSDAKRPVLDDALVGSFFNVCTLHLVACDLFVRVSGYLACLH